MRRLIIFLLSFCALSASGSNEEFSSRVVNVIDGNTFEVLNPDQQIQKLILAGVDTPELTQDFGQKAKRVLEKLILNKDVIVKITGKDRWGNHLAIVRLAKNDFDPRIELLEEGLAWTSERNPQPELESIRVAAQEKRKGLWEDANPIPPWTYRRQQTMLEAKSS